MKSPLSRVIIVILAGYLLILLILSVSDWIQQEYPKPPHIKPNQGRIQHPYYHRQAEAALRRFSGLPESKKKTIKQSLKKSLISVARWRRLFNQLACHILCLGEHHEEPTRAFLSSQIFPQISADVLMLEAFVFFLDEIGVEKRSFVIADTGALHPKMYNWFPRLARQTLRRYETVIVFRG